LRLYVVLSLAMVFTPSARGMDVSKDIPVWSCPSLQGLHGSRRTCLPFLLFVVRLFRCAYFGLAPTKPLHHMKCSGPLSLFDNQQTLSLAQLNHFVGSSEFVFDARPPRTSLLVFDLTDAFHLQASCLSTTSKPSQVSQRCCVAGKVTAMEKGVKGRLIFSMRTPVSTNRFAGCEPLISFTNVHQLLVMSALRARPSYPRPTIF